MSDTRPRRHWRPSPQVADALRAVLVLAVTLSGSIGEAHPSNPGDQLIDGQPVPVPAGAVYLLVVAASLVLVVRRRYPLLVLLVSLAAALAYTAAGYVNGAVVIAPMVALYAAVAHFGRAREAVLLGLGTAGSLFLVGAARGPYGLLGGSQTVIPFLVAAVVAWGLAVANRRAYVAEIRDRADRAERSREDDTRRRVDAERLRIAREMHDVVAHTMATINVQAGVAAHVIADRPEQAADALQVIKTASKDGLRELRAILTVLRAVDQPDGTEPAPSLAQLDSLIEGTRRAGLPTAVYITGQPSPLPAAADLAAFRIIQESLTNSIRHAGPATAAVTLTYGDHELRLDIADTGTPAPSTATATVGSGYGQLGMQERAAAIGGTVLAGPEPGGGYRVRARLPLPADP